jgi:hypothetical protein
MIVYAGFYLTQFSTISSPYRVYRWCPAKWQAWFWRPAGACERLVRDRKFTFCWLSEGDVHFFMDGLKNDRPNW